MIWGLGLFAAFLVYIFVRSSIVMGPSEVSEDLLQNATQLLKLSADDCQDSAQTPWQELGKLTTGRGLDLKFDSDDDPAAEATLRMPGIEKTKRSTSANVRTITLSENFETHHVHTGGAVFRVELRGTGKVIGKQTRLQMVIDHERQPYAGRIENDDDTDAAVGDWIQIKRAEILAVT